MYDFSDDEYDLLTEIALCRDITDRPQKGRDHRIKPKTRARKTRLIREFFNDRPIEKLPGESLHNAQIRWLNENYPEWNDPIPNIDEEL
ncbi:hypothetical protein Lepto7375DRAFT_7262 [Leptolyngbya sp. PCC 7375]|nr:hypothetical protein Lepto7375DRAFT_7262 [Leptolyngbya sp. PCC 7375]